MKRSKRYKEAFSKVDRLSRYDLTTAISLLKSVPVTKFDETVEIHMNLGVDPRKADQQIRSSLVLPHGTGKDVRVLVFAEGEKAEQAKAAGAEFVGVDEYIDKITKDSWMEFDTVIATPNLMGKIGKLGRVLGPRGLMPNPKVGTVTMDVETAVREAKSGKVVYRVDKFSNIHVPAGKLSFEVEQIKENLITIIAAIIKDRPAALKGTFIKTMTLTSTMGPGVKLDVAGVAVESKS